MRSRLRHVGSLIGLAGRLVIQRLRYTAPRRTTVTILGVAFAIGLCVTVSGVSVALASQGSVVSSNVDYWIVPDGESSSTLPVSVGGSQFGSVHPVAERLSERDDVRYASPVALSLFQVTHNNTTEYVLIAGVIAHEELTVAGVNASGLTAGDPHYRNGTYQGPWTDEIVLSSGASDLLGAEQTEQVMLPNQTGKSARSFTVTTIATGGESGVGNVPVALVHLSELQSLTGASERDTADQILVSTNRVGAKEDLEQIYDHSRVITRSDSGFSSVTNSDLALALAAAGFLVSLIIGMLFVATTMGLEVTTDRRLWATFTALGFSRRSRAFLILLQTCLITLLGGLIGVAIGRLGVFVANRAVSSILGETVVAVYPIEFVGYGLLVALGIGLVTTPYLLWLTARGSVTETLSR